MGVGTILALAGIAPVVEGPPPAMLSIRAADLEAHVRFLASDELQGRALGHPGNDVAALYLASVLERLGLETEDGYFQWFEVSTSSLGKASSLTQGTSVRYPVGEDFYPLHTSASATVTAGLVFAGYGITAPELSYDDYAGLDVRGEIVVAFQHEAQEYDDRSRFAGRAETVHARVEAKIDAARARGALGLILLPDSLSHPDEPPALDWASYWPEQPSALEERYFSTAGLDPGFVSAAVSGALAEKLLQEPLEPKQVAIQKALGDASEGEPVSRPASFAVDGPPITLAVDLSRVTLRARNVVGYLKGSHRAEEIVVLGAHFDHEGIDADGRVYNGADDNASGTAGVLEVAEAFTQLAAGGRRPRRTVVFALWNGEERGLLGSRRYAKTPLPKEARLVANLNLDMIGRNEDVSDPSSSGFHGLERTTAAENANVIHMIGYSFSPHLAARVDDENRRIGLTIKKERDRPELGFLRTSDHWPFLEREVPAIFLYTGEHPDVHTPSDDVERIDFAKMERVARLAFLAAWSLANEL